MPIIVYKVGGSLLTLPDLGRRLSLLFEQPCAFCDPSRPGAAPKLLLVPGGGMAADVVRQWDEIHRLGSETAHDLAMQSMSLNAQLLAAIVPGGRVVGNRAEAEAAWSAGSAAVLAAYEFVNAEERNSGELLPRSWEVTSDSVAAYVGLHWPADALVMIKSVPLPADCEADAAVRRGLVDPYFSKLVGSRLPVGWVDLRAEQPVVERWQALVPIRKGND